MIEISTLKHSDNKSQLFTQSHKLNPREYVDIFLLFQWEKQHVISILEENFLETISGLQWNLSEINTDFSYVTEKSNHFIQNINEEDKADISILFAILVGNSMLITSIWNMYATIVESDEALADILQKNNKNTEFEYIADGKIHEWSTLYLSNQNLEDVFGRDILLETTWFGDNEWSNICENIGKREVHEHLHIFKISNKRSIEAKKNPSRKQSDIMRGKIYDSFGYIKNTKRYKSIQEKLENSLKIRYFQYIFFIVWIVLLFLLTYSIVSIFFSALSEPKNDVKTQILQAKELIDQSQKLTNNQDAFNNNINQAEKILIELKDDKSYTTDINSLLERIEAMKKEINDIQVINLTKYSSIVPFDTNTFSPIGAFEFNKKLNLIWKEWAILGYTRGESINKILPYPTEEKAKDFDVWDDGNIYILTENQRILTPRRDDISYVTVTGQNWWEASKWIQTFNGNIYLIGGNETQLYKHKPGINGFSAQSEVLNKSQTGIADIGIDGGFYILYKNGKIGRYVSSKSQEITFLTLNKIPGVYDIGNGQNLSFFVRPNLTYIYILSGNKIWIFQPDSKRFQDVTALNYIAQMEIQTEESVRQIFVPRDGTIYTTTENGIYDIQYEIANGKLLLR